LRAAATAARGRQCRGSRVLRAPRLLPPGRVRAPRQAPRSPLTSAPHGAWTLRLTSTAVLGAAGRLILRATPAKENNHVSAQPPDPRLRSRPARPPRARERPPRDPRRLPGRRRASRTEQRRLEARLARSSRGSLAPRRDQAGDAGCGLPRRRRLLQRALELRRGTQGAR